MGTASAPVQPAAAGHALLASALSLNTAGTLLPVAPTPLSLNAGLPQMYAAPLLAAPQTYLVPVPVMQTAMPFGPLSQSDLEQISSSTGVPVDVLQSLNKEGT